jgi:hypothetical protein
MDDTQLSFILLKMYKIIYYTYNVEYLSRRYVE